MVGIESREVIRSRMLKEVAKLWGYKETEVDVSGFDPLINLLIGACAKELEHVSQEIQESSTRVLKHLVSLLTPDVLTGALPAHAIMHARSVEPISKIIPTNEFSMTWDSQEETKEISFSAINPMKIFNADIKYIIGGNKIIQLKNSVHKEVIEESTSSSLPYNSIWLGVDLDRGIESLKGLSFFFDWNLEPNKQHYFYMLPYTHWYIDGTQNIELKIKSGMPINLGQSSAQNLKDEFNVNRKIEEQVRLEYENQFITIEGVKHDTKEDVEIDLKKLKYPFPQKIKEVFSAKEIKTLSEDLLWIRIDFPDTMPERAVQSVNCTLNCIPVINRKLNERFFSLKSNLNILPLQNDDYFFIFERLNNDEGLNYQYVSSIDFDEFNVGTYTLRRGGVKRFDNRNASETVSGLLDLLRDESAAFSAMGLDVFSSDIQDLNHLIARIQKKATKGMKQNESIPYILVNPNNRNDSVYAQYWTTTGAFSNMIPAGKSLILGSDASIQRDSIVLITTSKGGRNKLNAQQSIHQFKKALVSRGKIVTKEDVKSYCYAKSENQISGVEIKRGFMVDSRPMNGMIRTSDIWLTLSNDKILPEEWSVIKLELEKELNNLSTGNIPFRIKRK